MPQSKKYESSTKATDSALNAAIGVRVRDLRKSRGLTCQDVERLSERRVWAGHLSNLERGQQVWQAHHLEAVAAALGLRPRDLLPDDDARSSADPAPAPARPNPAPAPAPPETGAALAAAAGITETELQLVMALRAPELRALLEAIGQLAHAANTDRKPPDDTRARLERLLEPNRMGRRPATRSPAVKPPK